ncbi:MAG TPA: hypothetical protein VGK44_18865 [Casimicrobiaceae bacterium]
MLVDCRQLRRAHPRAATLVERDPQSASAANGMESAQSMVARADRKLYQAKATDRGRYSSAREVHAA